MLELAVINVAIVTESSSIKNDAHQIDTKTQQFKSGDQ